jgi:hypothetical protein
MRRLLGSVFILLTMCTMNPQVIVAQEVEQYVEITTVDGSVFVGQILSETETEIRFRTGTGIEIIILVSDIRSRKVFLSRTKADGLMRLDPTSSRLFFTATGRPLAKRAAYVSDYEVFFGFFAAGVTEKLVMAGGFSFIPGSSEQLIYVAPKYTVYNKKDRTLALGVLAGGITGEPGVGGLFYGVSTIGPPDRALSFGAGFLFGGGEIESTPIILVGGELQVSSKFKFMTENYIIPTESTQVVLSGGFRIIGGSLTSDVSLFTLASLLDEEDFPFLPWVSFTYHFGY